MHVVIMFTDNFCTHVCIITCIHVYVGIYRGMMDENNEQFVAYFLPTPATLVKRREDTQLGVEYQDDAE